MSWLNVRQVAERPELLLKQPIPSPARSDHLGSEAPL
jgi:hypothetical protein